MALRGQRPAPPAWPCAPSIQRGQHGLAPPGQASSGTQTPPLSNTYGQVVRPRDHLHVASSRGAARPPPTITFPTASNMPCDLQRAPRPGAPHARRMPRGQVRWLPTTYADGKAGRETTQAGQCDQPA
ncbi:hypothetical protein Dimus_030925, partial [Dionaea muscipula]